jgi:hypothetical protein
MSNAEVSVSLFLGAGYVYIPSATKYSDARMFQKVPQCQHMAHYFRFGVPKIGREIFKLPKYELLKLCSV